MIKQGQNFSIRTSVKVVISSKGQKFSPYHKSYILNNFVVWKLNTQPFWTFNKNQTIWRSYFIIVFLFHFTLFQHVELHTILKTKNFFHSSFRLIIMIKERMNTTTPHPWMNAPTPQPWNWWGTLAQPSSSQWTDQVTKSLLIS